MQETLYFLAQVLACLTDHAVSSFSGVLDGAKVVLFSNTPQLTDSLTLADLTVCNFDGYATSAGLTWQPPLNVPTGGSQLTANSVQFSASDGTVKDTIQGYGVVDSGGTHLLWAVVLATPIQVTQAGDGVVIVPAIQLTDSGFALGNVVP